MGHSYSAATSGKGGYGAGGGFRPSSAGGPQVQIHTPSGEIGVYGALILDCNARGESEDSASNFLP